MNNYSLPGKQAELLFEGLEALRLAVAAGPLGLLICDSQDKLILAEGRALQTLRIDPSAVTGMAYGEILGQIDPKLPAKLTAAGPLKSGRQTTFMHRGGAFELHSAGLPNNRGSYILIIDVSEPHRELAAARAREERLRRLSEASLEAVSIHVADRMLEVNDAFGQMLGYDYDEVIGRSPYDFVAPESHASIPQHLPSDGPLCYQILALRKDGSTFPAEVVTHGINYTGQKARVSTIRDVSVQVAVERAHSESEARYRELFENANDIIYTHDLAGFITSINRTAERLFGYHRAEALSMNIQDIVVPEDLDFARQMTAQKVAEGESANYELRVLTRDGRRITLELSTRLILENGVPIGVQGIGRDISERKRIEGELTFRLEFEELITSISTYFIHLAPDESARGIREALQAMGEFAGIDRSYVFLLEQQPLRIGRGFEWCAPGVKGLHAYIQGRPLAELPWFAAQMHTQQSIHIPLAENLPPEAAAEQAFLTARGIRSMLGVPLLLGSSLIGFLGLESHQERHWSADTLALMKIVGEIFVNAIERERSGQALRESEERYKLAAMGANDGLWDWDLKSNTVYYSARWKSMLGYGEAEIGSAPDEWLARVHPDDRSRMQADLMIHINGDDPHFESEQRVLHKDGVYHWMLSRGIAVRDAAGKATRIAGSQTDITERKAFEERLQHDALHDPLTKLPNRALFLDRLERCIQRRRRNEDYQFGVLFLDFDRFKIVNDGLGHAVGDQFLVEIAGRLATCLRPADTVARLGGDEFAILLDDLHQLSDATVIADRIQEEIARPFTLGNHEVFSTVSIGIVLSSPEYLRPEELLRDADTAMYRAKSLGKARYVVFDAGMHVRALERLQLETELRWAVEREEFHILYQPIIDLSDGRVAGFEALLRWKHPTRGLIAAPDFIPIIEETGLILPVGQWVIQAACQQMKRWHEQFPQNKLSISVNLSPRQFTQADFIAQIAASLKRSGIDPQMLNLEITEGVLMEHATEATRVLADLKALNIQLHIDDFGTGYSSLSYLHRFPIDALKIDRSFVSGMDNDSHNAEIVRTIINLARSLEMAVIAEGVESASELALLRELGCDFAQGFWFAYPLDSTSVEEMLAANPHW